MEYEEMAEAYSTSEELHAGMSVSWSWDLTELVGEGEWPIMKTLWIGQIEW